MPSETKQLVHHPEGSGVDRGWAHVGQEQVNRLKEHEKPAIDYKEAFDVGVPDGQLQPNKWLPEEKLPGFRDFFENFFHECHNLLLRVLDSLTLAMNLEDHGINLAKTHSGAMSQLRLQHYPALPVKWLEEGSHTRVSAHADYGTLTLLFQDDIGGLEVEDIHKPGHFKAVEPIRGTVIINVGDLLERWSNGRWKGTVHQVRIPSHVLKELMEESSEHANGHINGDTNGHTNGHTNGVNGNHGDVMLPSRYSIPFFTVANEDVVVEALPGTWSDSNPKKYPPIKAWEHFSERLEYSYKP